MFIYYWEKLVQKNNIPKNGTIKLTIIEFERQLEKAYVAGQRDVKNEINDRKVISDDFKNVNRSKYGYLGDLFGGIFE